MMQTAATVVLCPPAPPTTSLDDIIRALEIIHERTSTNDARRQASEFLECQKQGGFAAAQNGYQLAINKTNTPIVRHFGLSLLHHLLKHGSMTLSVDEVDAVRELVCRLAACLTSDDLAYIRNKVAVLWAEVAKRTWALSWWTMDQELVELWEKSLLHKEFVLVVLETLSEDIIHHEDTISSLRGTDLNRKLVEIVMPQEAFDKSLVVKAPGDKEKVRFGSEGWLTRVSMLLQYCVQNAGTGHPEVLLCLQGSLTTLTSFLAWATAASIEVSQTVPNIFAALALENDEIILAAMDALHAMYGRTGCTMSKAVLGSIFAKDRLDFLMRLYSWSMVGPDQAGELKYTISKKVSELAAYLCSYLEYREYVLEGAEVEAFFSLLHAIVNHPSLVISIPILHSFSKLLACGMLKHDDNLYPTIVSVVQLCTTRIVRYEVLPDDSDDPSVQFLNEDIDTEPEKSAFTHNYRKYAALVIEGVVNARPDAMMHLLSQVTERLQALYDGLPPFQASEFHKYTRAQIRADTQFCVAEAVLRGFRKWEDAQPPESTDRTNLESLLESWGCQLMGCHFEDPYIRQRAMKVAVDTSTRVLYNRPVFGLRVLQYVMASFMRVDHDYRPYVEAVDELHHLAVYEVRRLAFRYSDHFAEYFDTLENQVREVQAITAEPNKPGIDLSPMLLIILQRTRALSPSARRPRLQSFRDAIQKAWTNPDFIQGTQTFEGFLRLFALDQVLPYLQSTGADRMEDWSAVPLDDKGRRLLSDMSTQFSNSPLRSTKSMVTVTTERFKPGDCAFLVARELWTDLIPVLVSTSMQLAKNAHTFHNPQSWPGLPANLHPMLQRVLTDRFWQAGISSGSKDDFYAKVSGSRFTLEGFASSVRAKIRSIRECSYSIIFSLSKLGDHFYRHEDLGAPLADALFTNSTTLSSHQFSVLLNIAQCIIRDCPANHMHHFLPPMISLLFTQIDQKLTAEWEKIERLKAGLEQADLAEEMKDESVLRQLTYTAVLFVANCFDPNKPVARLSPAQVTGTVPYEPTLTMRRFIISSPQILEPMLVFCTHVLQMKDTRCCGVICQVLRSVLDEFRPEPDTPTAASIREYISTEILKAAITSMHDPYFVDLQKDLAQLVASIWIQYGPLTSTPRSVIASLPSIDEKRVLQTESQLANTKSSRRQKALVLDLLENVRGVSVAEQGRITTREERRKQLSAFQAQYMKVEMEAQDGPHGPGGDDGPDLTGVAELLGEAS